VRPERVKHTHGKSGKRRWVAFVDVESATQRYYFAASERAHYDGALVPDNGRLRKARYLTERNAHRIVDRLGETAKSGSKHDPNRRVPRADTLINCRRRSTGRFG
jgi:hypothetical protein